jgi:hypothetical protein
MNPQWIKKFVELVKAGASAKAYQKKLGLNREGLKFHLSRLAEYEASLEPKKTAVSTPKAEAIEKKVSRVKSVLDKVRKREKTVEDKKDEEDKTT